jgi:hypothetical protein
METVEITKLLIPFIHVVRSDCLRESTFAGGFVVRLAVQKGNDMEHWRDENWRGQVDVLGEEPILFPLFSIINPIGLS